MQWGISGTSGPTDPTRAMLPFLFAVSASLDRRGKLGGMNDFYAAAKSADAKVVSF